MLLALDPGPVQTGYVQFEGGRVVESGVLPNDEILAQFRGQPQTSSWPSK